MSGSRKWAAERWPIVGPFAARPRLLVAMAAGAAAGVAGSGLPLSTRLILGWDVGLLLYLALVVRMMARADADDLQRRADREDPGAALVLALFATAALASLAGIGVGTQSLRSAGGTLAAGGAVLAGGTIVLSWLAAHTLFGLHYAHDYYAGEGDRKGLRFPGEDDPDYWDFMYFSFNLGAAAQTSDVQVESPRLRRVVLAHTIVSFLFNAGVLALAVNVGASLLGGS